MKQSLSYYIILLVLKLKGLKKDFSTDPIDFKRIRKQDVHQPKGAFFKKNSRNFKIEKTQVTEVKIGNSTKNVILFIHGGAFISGPTAIHWDTIQQLATHTNQTVWLCDYPKAPEHKISEISQNIDAVYAALLEQFGDHQVTLLGDSVGGTLITALVQRLVINELPLPHKTILVSPVMDASLTNPEIEQIDKTDPMLSKNGVLSAKRMCADNEDVNNPLISPIQGSFKHFPKTILYAAENDITFPDQLLVAKKMQAEKVDFELIIGKNMPHIWPFLPIMKEAKTALDQIIQQINEP